ncbi:HalOD1 output domain-containing protein [Natronobacterium gregoryi]|uniref:Halobacterial output domain-containing protein n=2 Tax=Natronobacterium gregoryi TaxID=44930 RepID=L0ADK8_NATGS|nr:HalOD1 output domain-containing protein [Natronobacterium gregoryi]AFZ71519.1 hypothetical protein Natgr_0261 [Natronobacterium gregoryi SP2]ELY66577.1 hypothetical protein C490_12432 [Natronobacterium gregoryi SP2]PLK21294.1 hypothetical protein CYV19_04445 [Natronobacterium gregoryi SP2]SFI82917.1 hypothetical protein SAMN05443661_106122 [Natronobacterium gregoryi]
MSDNLTEPESSVSWPLDSSVDDDTVTTVARAQYEPEPDAAVVAVVEAVASVTQQDPLEMPPLFGSVNTEALDELVTTPRENPVTVTFSYQQCRVTVSSCGDVAVECRTNE